MINRIFATSAMLAGLCALAGCSGDSGGLDPAAGGPDSASSRLVTLGSDDAFYEAWRAALAGEYNRFGAGAGVNASDAQGEDGFVAEADIATAAPQEGADAAADSGSTDGTGDFTTTNVQEQGVDEADLVKNDGEFLYVLRPGQFGCYVCAEAGEPMPADAAVEVAVDEPDASEPIPPGPDAQTRTQLRILSLQPDVPDSTPVADVPVPVNGFASGMFLHNSGDGAAATRSVLITASAFGGYYDTWNYSPGFAGQRGSVVKLDVTTPSADTPAQSLEFDGQIISSRKIDDSLVLALRYYPDIEGLDPYAYPTDADYEAALANIDLSAELPRYTRASDGVETPLVDAASCFVSGEVGQSNRWPDIITLAVFDANDLSLSDSACFLGASETLYASPEAVFLATTRWQYDDYGVQSIDGASLVSTSVDDTSVSSDEPTIMPVPVESFPDPRIDTDIHQFDLNGNQLAYAGSGRVSGHLGWNDLQKPFRMSEKDGDLRVVTMSATQDGRVSPVNLSVLRADGTGVLQTIGKLPNPQQPAFIGKPGEQLYASRFLGDRGYLVTFRSTDPLYVLDVANPADPKLAGELEVDGYSEYLHPIGDDYLLGIGMDAVPAPEGFGRGDGRDGGLVQGIKVSLYNVSNPAAPTEVDTLLLGQRGSYSSALYDHRAIAILPPGFGRELTRVAFGIDIAGTPEPARRPPPEDATRHYDWRFNALHGIEVRTGADAGLELTGRLQAASIEDQNGAFRGYGGAERAVMVGDSAYYIYGSEVRAANWFGFENPSPAR